MSNYLDSCCCYYYYFERFLLRYGLDLQENYVFY